MENVAAAVALAAANARATGRIYNVGEQRSPTLAEWVASIANACGWEGRVVLRSNDALPAHLRSNLNTGQHLVASTSRIRDELGYNEPVGPEEALGRTLAWECSNPPERIDAAQFDYAAEDTALAGGENHS